MNAFRSMGMRVLMGPSALEENQEAQLRTYRRGVDAMRKWLQEQVKSLPAGDKRQPGVDHLSAQALMKMNKLFGEVR